MHEVIIPPDEYRLQGDYMYPWWSRKMMKAQDKWCVENGITDWDFDDVGEISAVFKHIEDAVAFKLRWC